MFTKMISSKVIAGFVALILLAACGAPPTPAPQFTLRIGVLPFLTYLPYFVMQEQGLDRQNGIRFEETSYPAAAAVIKAMETGSLDVSYVGVEPVLSAAERGLIPDTIVWAATTSFADPDHPVLGVLAATSVNSWKDLEGQYIATHATKSVAGAAIKGRLQLEGVRDYTLVEIPVANMGLAVADSNVAAATMSEPYLTQSLLRGDGKLLSWIIGGPPIEEMPFGLLIFRTDVYRNNPQAVKAFLRAHLQAVEWINQNPDEARSLLTRRLGLSEEVGKKIILPYWLLDARINPSLLESMQPLLVEIGMLKAPIPARQLYDETLLDQVLAEKR